MKLAFMLEKSRSPTPFPAGGSGALPGGWRRRRNFFLAGSFILQENNIFNAFQRADVGDFPPTTLYILTYGIFF